jgi:hypothetical protein
MTRRRVLLPLLLALLLPGATLAAPDAPVRLEIPGPVEGHRFADLDGDGVLDLLVLSGRRLAWWPGRKGRLPAPVPRRVIELPADVSFVDALPGGLLLLGTEGLRRLPVSGDGGPEPLAGDAALAWVDRARATFAPLALPDGRISVPTPDGWRLVPAGGGAARALALPPLPTVKAPGGFLEDTGLVTVAHASLWTPPGGGDDVWAVAGTDLVRLRGEGRTRHDLAFLPSDGDLRLVDLDGDGAPEAIHRRTTNQEGTYAVFSPPMPGPGPLPEVGASLKPPAALLRLSGFHLDPDWTDLDGDGRVDLVLTTIPIDARNTARAMLSRKVTATTHAFLGRGREGRFFASDPDASIVSDVGVTVRFSPAGNIDVSRSFTIVPTGDYDGDGRKDLLIRTAPAILELRAGVAAGVFAKDARVLSIPDPGESPDLEAWPADLTGDGKDELVLRYPPGHGGADRLWVASP